MKGQSFQEVTANFPVQWQQNMLVSAWEILNNKTMPTQSANEAE